MASVGPLLTPRRQDDLVAGADAGDRVERAVEDGVGGGEQPGAPGHAAK